MGPINPGNREQFRADMERWKARAERPYARDIASLIRQTADEVAMGYENGLDPMSGPLMQGGHERAIQALMTERNRGVARAWADMTRRDAKSIWNHERKDFTDNFDRWSAQWLATVTARKVVGISQTTRRQIQAAVRQAQDAEVGIAAGARLIRQQARIIGAARALTISRTEINQSSNAATLFAADALDVIYRKEWVAALSERTREAHTQASGQVVGQDEAFIVDGETMMHPGDPSGSAANVINCRCASALIVE